MANANKINHQVISIASPKTFFQDMDAFITHQLDDSDRSQLFRRILEAKFMTLVDEHPNEK